jgi:hypothetical protein
MAATLLSAQQQALAALAKEASAVGLLSLLGAASLRGGLDVTRSGVGVRLARSTGLA